MRIRLLLAAMMGLPALAAASDISVREIRSDDTLLMMGRHRFDNGRVVNLTVGIGSGAFHHPDDPPNAIWTIGDRGPNIACGEIKRVAQMEIAACRETRNGRVYLAPSYAPSIYRLILTDAGTFRITDVITLKDRDGTPLNGMPNPLQAATTEIPFTGSGKPLAQELNGIDAEALIRLTDGTFWVADENAPSIVHVSADGRIITRHVPQGIEADYANARYDVVGTLPAILAKRQLNRGIEALAVSRDERFLFFALQSPLANPDTEAARTSRNVRLFQIERTSMQIVGEYVYVLDDPKTFGRDPSGRQADPRISEMTVIETNHLVVLERTEATTKLYEIDLGKATNIHGTPWDRISTSPSLEQVNLAEAMIVPVSKALRFDGADFPKIARKTEGVAALPDGTLVLINDDDFGIEGARTQIIVVRGLDFRGPQ
ncbi:MAG: esterase-like activity of phytase family protein [Pseudorhodoplanes sp.]|uniref:esterase-like activity of phytase family protein n=1 Tax=Pseudorhodoplanes sp. TaxID=1934341 RepID=UPI003D0E3D5F